MPDPQQHPIYLGQPGQHYLATSENVTAARLIRPQGRGIARLCLSLGPDKSLNIPLSAEALELLGQACVTLYGNVARDMPARLETMWKQTGE